MIKKRILIIGSNGMLGQKMVSLYSSLKNVELMTSSVEPESYSSLIPYKQIDITKKNEVRSLILEFFPDIVINAAAFTNVDKCETERKLAWNINVKGVENLALYTWTIDGFLVHLSTDYVFDGSDGPYTEVDKPNPVSYYGRTKLASENSLKSSGVRHAIIRTNVLYGHTLHGRPDFVKWVINNLKENKEIKIVTDQFNNPAFIDDLADGINRIMDKQSEGVFNIAGDEVISRFEFTERIADFFKLPKNLIIPVLTKEFNQPARRPLKSGLITLKAQTELGFKPTEIERTFGIIKKNLNL